MSLRPAACATCLTFSSRPGRMRRSLLTSIGASMRALMLSMVDIRGSIGFRLPRAAALQVHTREPVLLFVLPGQPHTRSRAQSRGCLRRLAIGKQPDLVALENDHRALLPRRASFCQ